MHSSGDFFVVSFTEMTWGCLIMKVLSYQYRDSHYKDKTVSQHSYLHNGNPHTRKDHVYIETGPGSICWGMFVSLNGSERFDYFHHLKIKCQQFHAICT